MKVPARTILFIIGPTASGKSALAMKLARKLNGEIISADSMQVYRGMNIGTGKPTLKEQKLVSHHAIDLRAPSRTFSVYDFCKMAHKTISSIHARKKNVIVAGGTGLYVRALLQGLDPVPGPDPLLRKKLERLLREKGERYLLQRLKKKDPSRAAGIDENNPRRVLRALEIALLSTRKRKKMIPAVPSISELGFRPVVVGLQIPRDKLYEQINSRVDQMFRAGWIRETKELMRGKVSRTARQALGYSHLIRWLETPPKKRESLAVLKENIKRDTRHFAKRQMTWFKREKDVFWAASGAEIEVFLRHLLPGEA